MSVAYEYWYFGPVQTISPGWSTLAFKTCSADIETSPFVSGTEFCCETSIGIFAVCPVSAARSVL